MTKQQIDTLESELRHHRSLVFSENSDYHFEQIIKIKQLLMPVWQLREDEIMGKRMINYFL